MRIGIDDRRELVVLMIIAALALCLIGAVCILEVARAGPRTAKRPVLVNASVQQLIPAGTPLLGAYGVDKYTLVEFGDYECPACVNVLPEIKALLSRHEGKLGFAYRHLPLPSHGKSLPAAQAVVAAGLQGKFWQMHEGLLDNRVDASESLSQKRIDSLALMLRLDIARFERDRKELAKRQIDADIAAAERLGVRGTPTFFLVCPSGSVYRLPGLRSLDAAMKELK